MLRFVRANLGELRLEPLRHVTISYRNIAWNGNPPNHLVIFMAMYMRMAKVGGGGGIQLQVSPISKRCMYNVYAYSYTSSQCLFYILQSKNINTKHLYKLSNLSELSLIFNSMYCL